MSAGIAALFAHVSFWILLVYAWFWEELELRGILIFLVLWVGGLVAMPLLPYGGALFPSYVALLDIALVFIVFYGDVRLS